jgi:colanic acid biosynthesis glycosyl transferase WcaI
MRVILINRFFYPDASPTAGYLLDLAMDLKKNGFDCLVITSKNRYQNIKMPANLGSSQIASSIKICRLHCFPSKHHGLFARFLTYFSFMVSAFIFLLFRLRKDDILIPMTDPPLLQVLTSLTAKLKGGLSINWIQDMYPEVLLDTEIKIFGKRILDILRRLRNWSCQTSFTNVVIHEDMKASLIKQGLSTQKIRIISNWADGESIRPMEAMGNSMRRIWNLSDKFIVGYFGNMGRLHEFSTILNAARFLEAEPDIKILLVGGGIQRDWIEKQIKSMALSNVIMKPFQPVDDLLSSLNAVDVHMLTLQPRLNGFAMPSKLYNIMAVGKPVIFIGNKSSAIKELITNDDFGYHIASYDAASLSDKILFLRDHKKIRYKMGQRSRHVFEESFNRPLALSKWRSLLCAATNSCTKN